MDDKKVTLNRLTSGLISDSLNLGEAIQVPGGALSVVTGHPSGRSPRAKKYVMCSTTEGFDQSRSDYVSKDDYENLLDSILLSYRDGSYCQEVFANHDKENTLYIKVYTATAWHSNFVRNMFTSCEIPDGTEHWTLYSSPDASSKPAVYISFEKREILISGTKYAGEIKKSVFTVLNAILPSKDILPMHCSVNVDKKGKNPCIFFGLSGTGKTTLSSEENRRLIGDDEHAWSPTGIHNFEGGCYAKVINLSEKDEPEIFAAAQAPGSILENVALLARGRPDFSDPVLTENTRASYDISVVPSAHSSRSCGHPKNIIFLTCDAFGVLPPVSKLDLDEMRTHFYLGYTAKVAGTESSVKAPTAVFSFCYGEPFMPLSPDVYVDLLEKYVKKHKCSVWLVNTGWSGGPHGVGDRMPIATTRKIITAIQDGTLKSSKFKTHSHTGLSIPTKHSKFRSTIFSPENAWQDSEKYSAAARDLRKLFDRRRKELGI